MKHLLFVLLSLFFISLIFVFMKYFNCHGNPDYPFHSPFQVVCDGYKE